MNPVINLIGFFYLKKCIVFTLKNVYLFFVTNLNVEIYVSIIIKSIEFGARS